jgi:hypothetical protein
MTTGPNNLIQSFGETVTHIKTEVRTDYGEEQYRTETSQEIQAIVSSPTEEDAQQLEGRVDSSTYRLTVPSSVDVAVFRAVDDPTIVESSETLTVSSGDTLTSDGAVQVSGTMQVAGTMQATDLTPTEHHYDRDEFIVRGVRCEVASGGISDDIHPITGTEKQTVLVQAKE